MSSTKWARLLDTAQRFDHWYRVEFPDKDDLEHRMDCGRAWQAATEQADAAGKG